MITHYGYQLNEGDYIMIVRTNYDKLRNATETDLELIDLYGKQISSIDVELCHIVLDHLKNMVDTVHDMPNTELQQCYKKAIFDVVSACYKLDKALTYQNLPSWYVKENHIDCCTCMDRSEVTEALEDMLEDAPTYDGDFELDDEFDYSKFI